MTYEDLYPIVDSLTGIEQALKREYSPPKPDCLINDVYFSVQLICISFPLTYILVILQYDDVTVENFRSKNDAVCEAVRRYQEFKKMPKPENYDD